MDEKLDKVSALLEKALTILGTLGKLIKIAIACLMAILLGGALFLTIEGTTLIHELAKTNSSTQELVDANCDLDRIFIETDTKQAYLVAKDKQAYVRAFHRIYTAYGRLDCNPPLLEPDRSNWK